jgi:hypothetical protein
MHYMFWSVNLKVRDNLKDVGVDGRIILKYMLNKAGCNRDKWRTFVKTTMNVLDSIKSG